MRLPHAPGPGSEIPYDTAPVSAFLLPGRIVTIESTDIGLLQSLEQIKPA